MADVATPAKAEDSKKITLFDILDSSTGEKEKKFLNDLKKLIDQNIEVLKAPKTAEDEIINVFKTLINLRQSSAFVSFNFNSLIDINKKVV